MSNQLANLSAHDDEHRRDRKRAMEQIINAKVKTLKFLLEAIGGLQACKTNLRLGLKAGESGARIEQKYVKFLYWDDMNQDLGKLLDNMNKLIVVSDYLIDAFRTLYDESIRGDDPDTTKMLATLRESIEAVTPEPEMGIEF